LHSQEGDALIGNVLFVKSDWSEIGQTETLKSCEKFKVVDQYQYRKCREENPKTYDEFRAKQKKEQELAAPITDNQSVGTQ
jgi:hypothetical protein